MKKKRIVVENSIVKLSYFFKYIIRDVILIFSKKRKPFKPVFLIGCGRSGTTILGNTLGRHDSISFLNERKDLWHMVFPFLDIWTLNNKMQKIEVDESDVEKSSIKKIRTLFYKEQLVNCQDIQLKRFPSKILAGLFYGEKLTQEGDVLLEKLPINSFRLRFICFIFPNAKFIYLIRNGLEVAASIERQIGIDKWYGENNIKWKLIRGISGKEFQDKELSDFEKGLLEWRLSVESSQQFFISHGHLDVFTLSYESFINDPVQSIKSIFDFLKLGYSEEFVLEITKDIKRKSSRLIEINDSLESLGGVYLKESIRGTIK